MPLQTQFPTNFFKTDYGPAYYVATTGNDTTGNGTQAAPWKTLSKALATVPDIKCQILLADGVYQENTGGVHYLHITRAFSQTVTIQPLLGAAGNVTVQSDLSQTGYNWRLNGCQNLTFRYINILAPQAINFSVVTWEGVMANIIFDTCHITVRSVAATTRKAMYVIPTSLDNLQLINCTIDAIGTDPVWGLDIRGATITNVTIRGGNVNVNGYGIMFLGGVTNIRVDGVTVATGGNVAVELGEDATSGNLTTGSVTNCTISSQTGHSLLIGAGCNGVTATNNTITGGNIGLVFKECNNCSASGNTISDGTTTALYFKAAVGCTADNNIVSNNSASVVLLQKGDTGNKCQNVTLTNNEITATGTADCLLWGNSTHDAGGGVCDYNTYDYSGSTGNVGDVRAAANITTLTALQGAWAGYDIVGNDANSSVVTI